MDDKEWIRHLQMRMASAGWTPVGPEPRGEGWIAAAVRFEASSTAPVGPTGVGETPARAVEDTYRQALGDLPQRPDAGWEARRPGTSSAPSPEARSTRSAASGPTSTGTDSTCAGCTRRTPSGSCSGRRTVERWLRPTRRARRWGSSRGSTCRRWKPHDTPGRSSRGCVAAVEAVLREARSRRGARGGRGRDRGRLRRLERAVEGAARCVYRRRRVCRGARWDRCGRDTCLCMGAATGDEDRVAT